MKVKTEDHQDLKLHRKDTKVWLVKIPSFLHEQWTHQPAQTELGRLRIYKEKVKKANGKQEPVVTMHLPSQQPWTENLPKTYNLKFTNVNPVHEYVFTETDQLQAREVAGKIQHEATIGPVMDDEYRRIMQERTLDATTKSRFALTMDTKETKTQGFKAIRNMQSGGFGLMRKKESLTEKRERMPRSDLLDILFAEFGSYPYWTFKGLVERTNQPQAWLKECLTEIAVLNKRGPYAGMYQLLPEYRKTEAASSSKDE